MSYNKKIDDADVPYGNATSAAETSISSDTISKADYSGNNNTQEEQSRKQIALDSAGMTEQNGKAAWLPERIDSRRTIR